MKKIKYILPVAAAIIAAPLTLTSFVLPLKEAAPEQVESEFDIPTKAILKAFDNLTNGFKISGTVNQARAIMGYDIHGNLVPAQSESQSYRVDVIYEAGERNGTALLHFGNLGGMESIIDQLIVYEDEEGYCYSEYLDHKNTVQRKYIVEDHNKLNYSSAGLYNFAEIFNENDFKFDQRFKRYNVDLGKTSIVVKNILGHQNTGFLYTPLSANIKLSNEQVDSYAIQMEPFMRVEESEQGQNLVRYTNSVTFKFSEIGTAKIPQVKAFESKPENKELYDALQKVDDNVTLDLISEISINDQTPVKKFSTYKFDGTQILVHNFNRASDKDTLKANDHFILKPIDESNKLFSFAKATDESEYEQRTVMGFARNYQGIYYYEDLLPEGNEVSTDFFTYNQETNEYVCTTSSVLQEINRMFTISKAPFLNPNIDNAQALGIRVNENGDVDYVKYYVNYIDPFSGTKNTGTIRIEYSNIGSTTI